MFGKKNKQLCFAPYNSIFFSIDGSVYFCLRNKNMLIGKYPEQSVHDIIEGENIRKLRKEFEHTLFPEGCDYCRYHYDKKNKESALLNIYKDHKPNKNYIPCYFDFELSNQCNLSCLMCSPQYSSTIECREKVITDKVFYTTSFADEIIKYAAYIKKASFRGGEPFLIDLYFYMWENLIRLNPKISINLTTNALVLNEKVLEILKKGVFNINISIDSLNRDLYEKIKQGGSFDKFKENLEILYNLREKKLCNLFTCVCLMKVNWHEMPAIFSYANKNRLKIFVNYVEKPKHLSLFSVPESEINEIIRYFKAQTFETNNTVSRHNTIIYNSMVSTLEQWKMTLSKRTNYFNKLESEAAFQMHKFFEKWNNYKNQNPIQENNIIRFEKILNDFLNNTKGLLRPEVIFYQLNKVEFHLIEQYFNNFKDDLLKQKLIKLYETIQDDEMLR